MNGFSGAVGAQMCIDLKAAMTNAYDSKPTISITFDSAHTAPSGTATVLAIDPSKMHINSATGSTLAIDGHVLTPAFTNPNHPADVLTHIESAGLASLRDLDGFYAMSFFDIDTQTIHLLRDQWGAHAIYYVTDERGIAFSTNIVNLVPILGSDVSANLDAAGRFLIAGKAPQEGETFFAGIRQVPSRSVLTIRVAASPEMEITDFHTPLRLLDDNRTVSYEEAVTETRKLFRESVANCLKFADAPGFTVSGGVDSSAGVVIAREQRPHDRLSTYSYVTNLRKSIDEERYMDLVNLETKSTSNKLTLEADDFFTQLPIATALMGSPLVGSSQLAQFGLYQLASRNGIGVMINGVEADSAFCGHNYFLVDRLLELIDQVAPFQALKLVTGIVQSRNTATLRLVAFEVLRRLPDRVSRPIIDKVQPNRSAEWLGFDFPASEVEALRKSEHPGGKPRLQSHLRFQLSSDRLLRYAELCGAAFSIYSRTPFLFRAMNEYIYSLPSSFLISEKGETKQFLRSVVDGIVPAEVLSRRDKIGFEAPTREWLESSPNRVNAYLDTAVKLGIISPVSDLRSTQNANTISRVIAYTEWAETFEVKVGR